MQSKVKELLEKMKLNELDGLKSGHFLAICQWNWNVGDKLSKTWMLMSNKLGKNLNIEVSLYTIYARAFTLFIK